MPKDLPKLKLLSMREYGKVDRNDPLRHYYAPVIGRLYRQRVEMSLAECSGGKRILEVGFGSGLSFLNLNELYDEIYGLDLKADATQVEEVFRNKGIIVQLTNGDVLQMPYEDSFFDTILLISILEHMKPEQLDAAFTEIRRVLRPGGQVVYGVPVERPFMTFAFLLLRYNIHKHHFSTETDVYLAAEKILNEVRTETMQTPMGPVYQIGHFTKRQSSQQ